MLAQTTDIFSVRHLSQAVVTALDLRLPVGLGHGFAWGDLGILAR